jgi:hypothetical protein
VPEGWLLGTRGTVPYSHAGFGHPGFIMSRVIKLVVCNLLILRPPHFRMYWSALTSPPRVTCNYDRRRSAQPSRAPPQMWPGGGSPCPGGGPAAAVPRRRRGRPYAAAGPRARSPSGAWSPPARGPEVVARHDHRVPFVTEPRCGRSRMLRSSSTTGTEGTAPPTALVRAPSPRAARLPTAPPAPLGRPGRTACG